MVPKPFAGPSPVFWGPDPESRIKICTHYILAHSDLISLYFVVQQFFDQKNLFIEADYNCLKVLKLDICLGLLKRPFNRRLKVPDRFIALKNNIPSMINRQEDHLLLISREMPADLLPTYMYRVRYMIFYDHVKKNLEGYNR